MSYRAVVLPVMIASPSDVAKEREAVRDIVNMWNYAHSESRKAVLMPMGWETHTAPELGAQTAQGLINTRVLDRCDLLVAVFWTRLGTPTENAASGSVEEVERHLTAGKPALVYFSETPVSPGMIDSQQYDELKKFKQWCYTKGLVQTFSSLGGFRETFSHQLNLTMNENPFVQELLAPSADPVASGATQTIDLSTEGTNILRAAAESDGQVLKFTSLSGTTISAGGKAFGGDVRPRELAKWLHGFDELLQFDLIQDEGVHGEVFRVTELGYQYVEGSQTS